MKVAILAVILLACCSSESGRLQRPEASQPRDDGGQDRLRDGGGLVDGGRSRRSGRVRSSEECKRAEVVVSVVIDSGTSIDECRDATYSIGFMCGLARALPAMALPFRKSNPVLISGAISETDRNWQKGDLILEEDGSVTLVTGGSGTHAYCIISATEESEGGQFSVRLAGPLVFE